MVISLPDHWKEPYKDKGTKYDKITEIITEINTILGIPPGHGTGVVTQHSDVSNAGSGQIITAGERTKFADYLDAEVGTTYTVEVPAGRVITRNGTQSQNTFTSTIGVVVGTTGSQFLKFSVAPPDWLLRHAEDKGKTLTVTQVIVRWQNNTSADYLTTTHYYWVEGNTSTVVTLYTNPTDLGNGSTGFRNDILNGTDHTYTRGDWIQVRLDLQQTVASSCRIKSFQFTWTIS